MKPFLTENLKMGECPGFTFTVFLENLTRHTKASRTLAQSSEYFANWKRSIFLPNLCCEIVKSKTNSIHNIQNMSHACSSSITYKQPTHCQCVVMRAKCSSWLIWFLGYFHDFPWLSKMFQYYKYGVKS